MFTDTINVSQGNNNTFFTWNVHTCNTCHLLKHLLLSLFLFMFWIFTNYHYFTFTTNNFTFFAHRFH
ncbi:50S ribosomal protein L36 [Listeria monocytogenes]|nr:50S ribosomal protein L36 [Listeria monocytogenes]